MREIGKQEREREGGGEGEKQEIWKRGKIERSMQRRKQNEKERKMRGRMYIRHKGYKEENNK